MVNLLTGQVTGFMESVSNHIAEMPASEAILFGIASLLIISAIFAFIAKLLKQPLIPAYVIAGLIAGPLCFGLITSSDLIFAFLEIGIVFLLFTAGLEISFRKIREANITRILTVGTIQVASIFAIVYFTRGLFGLSTVQSIYLGIILAFSSTMVDIKLLADKGQLVTLHGRLVLGILLLQDLVAIVAIALLTTGELSIVPVVLTFAKLAMIILIAVLLQSFILDRLFRYAARSTELLFITSLGVLFSFIILSYLSEISIAIGAFIAGVSLANSSFKTELESRISPVKDFFSILFFVALGMQIIFVGLEDHLGLLVFLVVGALMIKPIILFVLLRAGAYQARTSFQTSIILGQLSEFSLILGIIGLSTGALDESLLSTIILATVITMSLTPYLIDKKDDLYKVFRKQTRLLRFLPERRVLEYQHKGAKTVLLIGAHRKGSAIIKELEQDQKRLIVIDHNPELMKIFADKKITCIYGDILSPEIFEKIKIKKLKLVVCTLPGFEENTRVLEKIKNENPNSKVIVTGNRISETLELYKRGADLVITPKIIAGQELVKTIHGGSKTKLKQAKKKHLEYLNDIHNVLY